MTLRKQDSCTRPLFYREIPLTQGQVAMVDVEDYDDLAQFSWHANWNACTRSYYASRSWRPGGRPNPEKHELMHRRIMGLPPDDRRKVDHIDSGLTLDNRRYNLRIATHAQNARNARIRKDSRTGFKGVGLRRGKWVARIRVDGDRKWLGYFHTPEAAYEAYCAAAKDLHGEFARLR